jgi:hypothetical protein
VALTLLAAVACSAPSPAPPPASAGQPSSVASAAQPPGPAAPSAGLTPTPAPRPARLAGAWLRADGDYVLAIDSTAEGGALVARYLNPRPIQVERAAWRAESGHLRLDVVLRDRGYPGSNYELTYEPASDTLFGVYHHLGLNQDFEVTFARLRGPDRRVAPGGSTPGPQRQAP